MGMSGWLDKAALSLIVGIIVAALIALPSIAWQYRRYGSLSPARLVGLIAVCIYTSSVVIYTWLPTLAEPVAQWCLSHTARVSLNPLGTFQWVADQLRGVSFRAILSNRVFLQLIFNVLLFIPFGVIMRGYFHLGVATSTLLGLATSTLIEFAQWSAFFGLYPCRYRVADVGDIVLNTSGAWIGAVIAPLILWWMPSVHALTKTKLDPRPVSSMRRLAGMIIDWAMLILIALGTLLAIRAAHEAMDRPAGLALSVLESLGVGALAVLFVRVGPAWNGWGASLGQRTVWLTPVFPCGHSVDHKHGPGTRAQRMENLLLTDVFLVVSFVAASSTAEMPLIVMIVGPLVAILDAASMPWTATKRGLSGWISGAHYGDRRAVGPALQS